MSDRVKRGLVLLGDRRIEVRESPLPKPGVGEILMRVEVAGICGSDLHFYRATPEELGVRLGKVAGHEPSGVVQSTGPGVSRFRRGDRIAVHHTLGCGYCEYCFAGETDLCAENIGIAAAGYGGDTNYALMPAKNCFHLSDELSFVEAAFIACTGATAYSALRKLSSSGRDRLAVFGLGPVGLSAVLIGKASGASVIGVDLLPERLEMAKHLGADEVVNAAEVDPVEAIRAITDGRGVESVVETSGSPAGQSAAVDAVRPKGKVAFIGLGTRGKSLNPEQFVYKEASLLGVNVMPANLYWEMIRFMIDRNLRFEPVVTHRVTLDEGPSAFAEFDAGTAGKFIFDPVH